MTTTPTTANPNAHDNICNICGGLLWGTPQHTGQINCPGHRAPTTPDKKLTPMAEAIEWIMQQDELLMNKTRMIIVAKLDTLLKKELEILPVSTCLSKIDGWSFDYDFLKEISKYANEIEDGISMEEVDAVLTAIKNYFTQNYRQQ